MKRVLFVLSVCLCLHPFASAQEVPESTEEQLETAAEATEDELQEDDHYLQELDYYTKHPVNLNTADEEDLLPLRMLTPVQVNNLLSYRKLMGKFIDVHELQSVPTFDIPTINKLLPYIYVGPVESLFENLHSRLKKGDQYLMMRGSRIIELSKGYDTTLPTHYLGDPNHLLFRYRFQYKNLLQFGLTGEKDAGEQFLKGPEKYGFDFYSFHVFARKLGIIKTLAIGDYVVNMGQGLTEWQSFGYGSAGDLSSIKRQSPVLSPYKSAGEFNFNRGAAATLQFKKIEVTAFGSWKKFSGNYTGDSLGYISSIQQSGYYRTKSEIADRDNTGDLSFGGNISFSDESFKVGLNSVTHKFSLPLQKRDDPYNYFAPSGDLFINSSVDYSYSYKNIHLFGEAAIDKDLHRAFVNGAILSVDPKVDLAFFYRNLSMQYQSLFGSAMTQNGLPSNEKGLYTAIFLRPITGVQINGYADFFHFPFLKYRVNAPSTGREYQLQVRYLPSKKTEIYARYRSRSRALNQAGTPLIAYPEQNCRQNLRIHFATQLSKTLTFKSRMENCWFKQDGKDASQGILAYVETGWKAAQSLRTNLRLEYFNTNDYDSRIYAYESDILYSYSIPALFDKGVRYYLNLKVDASQHFSAWLRWAQTVWNGNRLISSGLDQISGKRRSELKLQLSYTFSSQNI
jgi:hypothetical protein